MWKGKRCRCALGALQTASPAPSVRLRANILSKCGVFFLERFRCSTPVHFLHNRPFIWRTRRPNARIYSIILKYSFFIYFLGRVPLRGKRRAVREMAGAECPSIGDSTEISPPPSYGKLPDRNQVGPHIKRVVSISRSPTKIQNIFKQVTQGTKNVENVFYAACP